MRQQCEILILTTLDPRKYTGSPKEEKALIKEIKHTMQQIVCNHMDSRATIEEVMIEPGEPV